MSSFAPPEDITKETLPSAQAAREVPTVRVHLSEVPLYLHSSQLFRNFYHQRGKSTVNGDDDGEVGGSEDDSMSNDEGSLHGHNHFHSTALSPRRKPTKTNRVKAAVAEAEARGGKVRRSGCIARNTSSAVTAHATEDSAIGMRIIKTLWFDYLASLDESEDEGEEAELPMDSSSSSSSSEALHDDDTQDHAAAVSAESDITPLKGDYGEDDALDSCNSNDANNSSSDQLQKDVSASEDGASPRGPLIITEDDNHAESLVMVDAEDSDSEQLQVDQKHDDQEQLLEFPAAVLKMDLRFRTVRDVEHLLRTMRFWCLDDLPRRLCVFCLDSPVTVGLLRVIDEYTRYLPQLLLLRQLITAASDAERMTIAIENCNLHLIKWMHKDTRVPRKPRPAPSVSASDAVRKKSSIKKESGSNTNVKKKRNAAFKGNDARFWSAEVATLAARKGFLPGLQYAHTHHCPWNAETAAAAAEGGHLDCLVYIHENGCPWDKQVFLKAAQYWHPDCIIYALEQDCPAPTKTDKIRIHGEEYEKGLLHELVAYHGDVELLKRVLKISAPEEDWRSMQSFAVMSRNLECLIFVHKYETELRGAFSWEASTTLLAARYGALKCLCYALRNGCVLHHESCAEAFLNGHLDCLRYLRSIRADWESQFVAYKYSCLNGKRAHHCCIEFAIEDGCEFSPAFCNDAASRGHLECLQIAMKRGFEYDKNTCAAAAKSYSLECLQYLHENGCPWDGSTVMKAAMVGAEECLKYALENDCPIHPQACSHAAFRGNLGSIRILHSYGAVIDSSVLHQANCYGDWGMLEFIIRNGGLDGDTLKPADFITIFSNIVMMRSMECITAIVETKSDKQEYLVEAAVNSGNLTTLKMLHERQCAWSSRACLAAASHGHLDCLKYLRTHLCPWHDDCCVAALRGGHIDIFEFCIKEGAKSPAWEDDVNGGSVAEFLVNGVYINAIQLMVQRTPLRSPLPMQCAAKTGRLEVLKALPKLGFPWDVECCRIAAAHNNWHCLKHLHENGCPWDINTTKAAAESGSLSCLRYAHEIGCPWDSKVTLSLVLIADPVCSSVATKSMSCLSYMHENGCPWHPRFLEFAIQHNRLDMVKYALQNNFWARTHIPQQRRSNPSPEEQRLQPDEDTWDHCVSTRHLPSEITVSSYLDISEDRLPFQQWLIALNDVEILDIARRGGVPFTRAMTQLALDMSLNDQVEYLCNSEHAYGGSDGSDGK